MWNLVTITDSSKLEIIRRKFGALCYTKVFNLLKPSQPTKKPKSNQGRNQAKARDIFPCQIKSLPLTKRIPGPGKGRGYACANSFVVLSEGLDMCRLGAVTTGRKMNPLGNSSFTKRVLVGWMSERLTQMAGIALAEVLCDLWGNHRVFYCVPHFYIACNWGFSCCQTP